MAEPRQVDPNGAGVVVVKSGRRSATALAQPRVLKDGAIYAAGTTGQAETGPPSEIRTQSHPRYPTAPAPTAGARRQEDPAHRVPESASRRVRTHRRRARPPAGPPPGAPCT